jgi:hypothetical protein
MNGSTQQAVLHHYDALPVKAAFFAFASLPVFLPVFLLLP